MNLKLIEPKTGEAVENIAAALKSAMDHGMPFLMEWRQSDAQAQRQLDESSAGCSCGGGFD